MKYLMTIIAFAAFFAALLTPPAETALQQIHVILICCLGMIALSGAVVADAVDRLKQPKK